MSDISVTFTLNGREQTASVQPRVLLADLLRSTLGQTGTHLGCEHGVCGACTVLVDGAAVRSCLMLAAQIDGCEIATVEGMSAPDTGESSDLQQAFLDNNAAQCGFCTPGFLMLAEQLLGEQPDLDAESCRAQLAANICRCTGYSPIIDAVLQVARARRAGWSKSGGSEQRG